MYQRALTSQEIQYLATGQGAGAQQLSFLPSGNMKNGSGTSQQMGFVDDFTTLAHFKDLSTLIPWGTTGAGVSAFATDTVQGRASVFLTQKGMEHLRSDTVTGLRSFSALDYRFPGEIIPDSAIVTIEFSACWDSASHAGNTGSFKAVLINEYPEEELSGLDINNFNGDPYGTPAYTIRLQPGRNQMSFMQYGGANGGRFDNYQCQWWLPGSVGATEGSAPTIIGVGQEYPLSSWKSTNRAVGDTAWARYTWIVRPDCQELYRNDTLFGIMELPMYSFTAPGYTRYGQFKALRLAWQGQCLVSEVGISTIPAGDEPNRPPVITMVYPSNDTIVSSGAGLYILANAADADGSIDRVEFHADGQKLGEDSTGPYECSWQSVPEGIHEITATAIDDKGAISAAEEVMVRAASPLAQQ
jgi:hypothetical protein